MNTGWSPKPLRPEAVSPLFEMVEAPAVKKSFTPIERQRMADGTPHTITGPTALRPPDPALTLPETMVKKGSLVSNYDERPKAPKQTPEDPITVIKSYLAYKGGADPDSASAEKMQAIHKSQVEDMRSKIQDVLTLTGVKSDT